MYKIEKNVPMIEPNTTGRGRKSIYPWNDMEVGDSFMVSKDEARAASFSMRNWNVKNKPKKLSSRGLPNKDRRFWRIA